MSRARTPPTTSPHTASSWTYSAGSDTQSSACGAGTAPRNNGGWMENELPRSLPPFTGPQVRVRSGFGLLYRRLRPRKRFSCSVPSGRAWRQCLRCWGHCLRMTCGEVQQMQMPAQAMPCPRNGSRPATYRLEIRRINTEWEWACMQFAQKRRRPFHSNFLA